jgi:hypothetical protein
MEWLSEQETIKLYLDLFYDPQPEAEEDNSVKCLDTSSQDDVIKMAKEVYQADQELKKEMEKKFRTNE